MGSAVSSLYPFKGSLLTLGLLGLQLMLWNVLALPGIWFLYFLLHVLPAPPCIGSAPQERKDLESFPPGQLVGSLDTKRSSRPVYSSFRETCNREIGQGARRPLLGVKVTSNTFNYLQILYDLMSRMSPKTPPHPKLSPDLPQVDQEL